MYYAWIENNLILSIEIIQCENLENVEVSKELYDDYVKTPDKYMYSDGEIIINPNYEQEQADKREAEFKKDFFNTSLGWIRREVTMKNGSKKDFLTDLLPVISLGVSSGQVVNVITYKEPDYTQEAVDWVSLQEVKQATPQFIQECLSRVSKDFTGEEDE